MLIQPINNIYNYNNHQNPNFKSLQAKVFKPTGKGFHIKEFSHNRDTAVYRKDMDWKKLINFFLKTYKNTPKVSVYNYGCSNLSEAYTVLMQLFTAADKETAEKFLPIIAKDRDLTSVCEAQGKFLPMNIEEVKAINQHTNRNFFNFFNKNCEYDNVSYYFQPKPILKDNVKVGLGDITKEYKNIPKKDSILIARNFWVYLTDEERVELANNLYNHLEGNNVLVLGHHDYREWDVDSPVNAINLLKKAGFQETEIPYVLIKK